MKLDIGMETRSEILQYSLLLENLASIFLSTLLGIEKHEVTKTFSNQSGSLSFSQKIDLLIDIGALDKEEKKKFLTFMEIRNQFAHNFNAKSYELCFTFLDGKATFILKTFPQDSNLSLENQLQKAVSALANDVIKVTINLIDKVKEKFGSEVKNDIMSRYQKVSMQAIQEIENTFNDYYADAKIGKSIDIEELRGLGTTIRKMYYKYIKTNLTIKK